MYCVRPINEHDLDALDRVAHLTSLGMLSLPRDRTILEQKILKSVNAFATDHTFPENELYLFVLENSKTGEVGGTCGIYSKTSVETPSYFFTIETLPQKPSLLPITKDIKILKPYEERNGPSELCALFLEKSHRKEGLGELLSLSRFLFIAQHPQRFDTTIVARLRGFISKRERSSPFWEGLGRHFLNLDFEEVLTLIEKREPFIPEFLPTHPVYTNLLPKQAQYVIQKTHPNTRPALKILKKEGFSLTNQLDIFDAGPTISAEKENIRSVRKSQLAIIENTTELPLNSHNHIIANTRLDFRASYGCLKKSGKNAIIISQKLANTLRVNIGDSVRYVRTHG